MLANKKQVKLIENKDNDTTKVKETKPKESSFITLNDTSVFKDLKMPECPTNYTLWYKNADPSEWGVTIKRMDEKNDKPLSQHVWKLTWIYNDIEGILVPSSTSREFTTIMDAVTAKKLMEIRDKYIAKKKKSNI